MNKRITSKKGKDGYYHFYVGKKDVSLQWEWFFSDLSLEDESKAEELFFKKYPKL